MEESEPIERFTVVMGICNIVVQVSSLTGFRLNYGTERGFLELYNSRNMDKIIY